MMGINNDAGIVFRGIAQTDMTVLEKWYGMSEFGYATGFKEFSEIKQMLLEPIRPDVLILMIDMAGDNRTIGFIYGEIKAIETQTVLWIHILIIDPIYQHKGFGTLAINKLLYNAQLHFGPLTCIAAVSEKNFRGLSFWNWVGFSRSGCMEESLNLLGSSKVAIFKKILK